MESYTCFAEVYDLFMDNVPYDEWAKQADSILEKYNVKKDLVCELGCGTGAMTRRLSKMGYDMIGIDLSVDMLDIARDMEYEDADFDMEKGPAILYLNQDMREFELFGTVQAVVSFCDSMNYITTEDDLLHVFRLVNNYLDPGGIFLFDMNTVHKYRDILSNNTFAENRDEGSFIWENEFDEESDLNQYDLTLFIRDEEDEDIYFKYEEQHVQRAYEIDNVCKLIKEAGMELLEVIDVDTMKDVTENTERVYFVARECQK